MHLDLIYHKPIGNRLPPARVHTSDQKMRQNTLRALLALNRARSSEAVLLISFTLSLLISWGAIVDSLQIVPPSTNDDWRDLASLLVQTFDEPTIFKETSKEFPNNSNPIQKQIQLAKWNMMEKSLTEQFTYNNYARTARKMRGKKYAIYIAKEYNTGSKENNFRAFYEVVGMAEIGLTLAPSTVVEDEDLGMPTTFSALMPRATVGVLCVKPTFQQKGIGQALLDKCEETIVDVWGEKEIIVEVEPGNAAALKFFRKSNYGGKTSCSSLQSSLVGENDVSISKENEIEIRNATVRRMRAFEERPHLVLRKKIPTRSDSVEDNNNVDRKYAADEETTQK